MATEKKHELKDIKLFEENGQYYLNLKYIIEDEYRIYELDIPRVEIPFTSGFPIINQSVEYWTSYMYKIHVNTASIQTADIPLPISCFTTRIIKEKHKKMTVAEIEKKLGYKIEIVSEE